MRDIVDWFKDSDRTLLDRFCGGVLVAVIFGIAVLCLILLVTLFFNKPFAFFVILVVAIVTFSVCHIVLKD